MSSLAATGFVVFILILFVGVYLCLWGFPGSIIIFLDVLMYAFLNGFSQIGWKILLFLLILSAVTEAVDFWAGSTKVHKAPITRISFWFTSIGAAAGMIILTPVLWGPGIWIGFFIGGLIGLLIAEWMRQASLKVPQQTTPLVFFAMIGQKMLKGFVSLIMIFVSLSSIYS